VSRASFGCPLWRGLMEREVDHARRALTAALTGRLIFTAHNEGGARYYEFGAAGQSAAR